MSLKAKRWYFAGLVFSLLSAWFFFKEDQIHPSDLRYIENMVLSQKPTYSETTGKTPVKQINFSFVGFFDLFVVRHENCTDELRLRVTSGLYSGDTLEIGFLSENLGELNETGFHKPVHEIEIFSIKKGNVQYYDLEERNVNARKARRSIGLVSLLLTLLSFYSGYRFSKGK